MPNLLGVTNPTPGLDNTNNAIPNRNLPPSTNTNPQIQNVADPSRVVGPDGKTERQDSGTLDNSRALFSSCGKPPAWLRSWPGCFPPGRAQ